MINKFVHRFTLLLLILSTQASMALDEVLTIRITQGIEDARPIAIVPFKFEGLTRPAHNLDLIIAADLQRSGLFKPVPQSQMPGFPSSSQDIDIKQWRAKGIEAVVTGTITDIGNNSYRITYELVDVLQDANSTQLQVRGNELVTSSSPLLLSRQATVINSSLRMYAHQMADAIFEKLTGVRGAFATRIAYVAINKQQDKPYQLFVADSDGFAPQRLLASKEPIMEPSWAPDARRIAYVSFENGNSEIWVQNIYTGQRTSVSKFKGINSSPSWSPDGKKLAISLSKDGNSEVYTIDLTTNEFVRITDHYAIDTEPSWSPDGRHLIFTSDRGGRPQIYKKPITGFGKITRLTWEGDYNAGASYSPDGKYIIMVHRNQGVYHIAKQDVATRQVQVLTDTFLDESPSFAPNGSMIIYAALYQDRQVLAAVSIDGRFKARLPASIGGVRSPAWSPYLN